MLNDDIVSHGLLAQCVEQFGSDAIHPQVRVKDLLEELLTSGKVDIGVARLASPDFVEFVAWKGSVVERTSRAMDAVAAASGANKEFAYWLCLRQNVDRFES
jgi:hypothetical protein